MGWCYFEVKMVQKYSNLHKTVLCRSLDEIVKIWRRGSGKASFSVDINDGVAELRMTLPISQFPDNCQAKDDLPCETNLEFKPRPRTRKKKSPSQRRRDARRAEAFRERKIRIPDLVLPFSGEILPLQSSSIEIGKSTAVAQNAYSSALVYTLPATSQPNLEPPIKGQSQLSYKDVSLAKKQLFSHGSTPPPHSSADSEKDAQVVIDQPAYQRKEDEQWRKLFL